MTDRKLNQVATEAAELSLGREIAQRNNISPLSKEDRVALKISYAEVSRHSEVSLRRALLTIDELERERDAAHGDWEILRDRVLTLESRQKKLVEALKEIERLSWELGEQSPPAVRAIILSSLREIGEGYLG